jgi:hypothetical protein
MVAAKAMPGRENSMVQPSPEHTLNSRTVAGLGWLYLGLQQGGWSEEVITFIRLLAQHKLSASPLVPPTSNCSGIISSPFRTRSRTSPTPPPKKRFAGMMHRALYRHCSERPPNPKLNPKSNFPNPPSKKKRLLR